MDRVFRRGAPPRISSKKRPSEGAFFLVSISTDYRDLWFTGHGRTIKELHENGKHSRCHSSQQTWVGRAGDANPALPLLQTRLNACRASAFGLRRKVGGGAESWQSPLCEASADRFGKSASAFTRVKA